MTTIPDTTELRATDRLQVTIREAARLLSYDPRTIRRMIERGELPSVGHGPSKRIPTVALREWVERNLNQR